MPLRSRRAIRHRRKRRRKERSGVPAPDRSREVIEEVEEVEEGEVIICKCGGIVKYAGPHICEDCFVDMQIRWPGRSARARIL